VLKENDCGFEHAKVQRLREKDFVAVSGGNFRRLCVCGGWQYLCVEAGEVRHPAARVPAEQLATLESAAGARGAQETAETR
jgi:hypothetical protein